MQKSIFNLRKNKKILYLITLFSFSIFLNQYYGNLGVCPIDSFFSFNSGYDVLNGYYPFKDYWTVTGPMIALNQALIFKIFGVSWFSYLLQASIFNFLISFSTFYTLDKFKLNINYCFFYSLLVAVLAYPSSGSPYVDHQASILSIVSVFCFILALKTKEKIYWLILPIILGISFLTKQAPTGHIFLIISFISIVYFIFNFSKEKFLFGILGSIIFIGFFIIMLKIGEISFLSFYNQYILFPLSLGNDRLEFLFPLEFSRIFLRFKLIHLSSLILLFVAIKKTIKNFNYLKSDEFLITFSLLTSSYALIAHQLMTINGLFIFFIIPILASFSHIYYIKHYSNKNYIIYLLVFLSISSTTYYGYKYINKRDFMDLRNANMDNAVDAKILSNKLKGLKWISCIHPENPKKEIQDLSNAIKIIKNDNRNKSIITDYQFISVILSTYDFSPSQVWFDYHVNPNKESKYYKYYKNFFLENLRKNGTKILYLVKPLWGGNDIIEKVLKKDCFKKNEITNILISYELINCDELKN